MESLDNLNGKSNPMTLYKLSLPVPDSFFPLHHFFVITFLLLLLSFNSPNVDTSTIKVGLSRLRKFLLN